MNHTELNESLKSFALKCRMKCHEALGKHAKAVEAAKKAEESTAPPHIKAQIHHFHQNEIVGFAREANVHQQRAKVAESGFLRNGPDERTDAEHQRHDAELIKNMQKAGRVHWTDEPAEESIHSDTDLVRAMELSEHGLTAKDLRDAATPEGESWT
jgi:hypothetical protein